MRTVDRILTWLERWGADRWIHALSMLVTAWPVAFPLSFYMGRTEAGLVGAGVAAIIAVGKEIYDKRTTGLFDRVDLAFDLIGIIIFLIIFAL